MCSSLYFSGNVVRVRDDDSVAIGSYNLDEDTLTGMDTGLWTLGNSLPSGDSALSPTLLFAPLGEDIVIAGHFTHQLVYFYFIDLFFIYILTVTESGTLNLM